MKFDDKVYSATESMMGIIPGTDSRWICKADLSYLNTINASDKCELTANLTDNKSRYTMKIPVLTYVGSVTSSVYVFNVHTTIPEFPFTPWAAGVWSFIDYDDGAHTISRTNQFGNSSLKPSIKQEVKYYYHHITEVRAVITGTYKGIKLDPAGCYMKVPHIPMA